MNQEIPRHDQSTDATDHLPSDALLLGVDTEGLEVYHSRHETSIYVIAGDNNENEIVYERGDIPAGDELLAFVDHVADVRGWWRVELKETFADVLEEALE